MAALARQDKLFNSKAFLRLTLLMGPSGLIAILAGWFTTEMGRQPWVVYGLMRTADASSAQSVTQMSLTLLTFVVVYFSLFGVGIGYMMRLVRKGVTHEGRETNPGGAGQKRTPARPLSAAGEVSTKSTTATRKRPTATRTRGTETWVSIFPHLGGHHHLRHHDVRGDGRLRPGHRHALSVLQDSGDRDVMMNTVAPVWDGNETWLVLGGAALFGAFRWLAVVLSALYLPLIFMLVGLIFRGVAFEFRFKAKPAKQHIWDKAFIGGSLVATFFQGVALGAFIEASRWRTAASPAVRWTGSRRSRCSAAWP